MLPIERFATIRAEIERSAELDRVLEGAGLLRAEWSRLEKHWQGELAREIAAGRRDLSERYLAAFFGGGTSAEEPEAPAPREGSAPKALFVPTYLAGRTPQPAPAPVQPAPRPVQPVPVHTPPVVLAQPPKVPAPLHVEVPAHIRVADKASPGSTVFVPELDQPRPGVVTLPFATKPTPSPMNATFVDDGKPRAESAELPFEGKRATPPAAQPIARGTGTGTELLDEGDAGATTGPTVPEGLPVLTVDQYAWMMAKLKRTPPAEMAATLGRFRLTEAGRAKLQEVWKAHMDSSPGVRAAYVRAFANAIESMSAPPAAPELPLPVERFAALQASLVGRGDRDAVLRSQGIDPSRWPDLLRVYGEAMKRSPELRRVYEALLVRATQPNRR